jgi:DMSO/TMAO reductase YedYZ molybdopterin-dependent catalytic subunit
VSRARRSIAPSRRRSSGRSIWRRPIARRRWSSPRALPPIYDIEEVKPIDGATWKLELTGRIDNKQPWTAQQIYQPPEEEIIIKHICVEGWDYIRQWSGPNLRDFLQRVGADLAAKYICFICNDDYTESIDMATALHPQTILATKYAGAALADPFGYPLQLRTSTKLGYKNAKWIRAIEVTNDFRDTFWSKQGFNWLQGFSWARGDKRREACCGTDAPDLVLHRGLSATFNRSNATARSNNSAFWATSPPSKGARDPRACDPSE